MAALARRTWSQILDECIRLHGGTNYSSFSDRMKYWICESYFYLTLTVHNFEMDKIDTSKTCSTSTNEVTLPTDCFAVTTIRIKNTSGTYLGQLSLYDAASLWSDYNVATIPDQPKRFSRLGSKIYFDVLPDQAYPLEILYTMKPTNPDFTGSDSPLTSEDMDCHIIEGALALAHSSTGRPDLAEPYQNRLDRWLAAQVRSSVVEQQIVQAREGWSTDKSIGGAQG